MHCCAKPIHARKRNIMKYLLLWFTKYYLANTLWYRQKWTRSMRDRSFKPLQLSKLSKAFNTVQSLAEINRALSAASDDRAFAETSRRTSRQRWPTGRPTVHSKFKSCTKTANAFIIEDSEAKRFHNGAFANQEHNAPADNGIQFNLL